MYKTIDDVDAVLKAGAGKKILILKHSATCPFSARGKREVDNFLAEKGSVEAYLVVVQQQRSVSKELAGRLGVKHESPQVLLIKDGKAEKVWNHRDIRKELIEEEAASAE